MGAVAVAWVAAAIAQPRVLTYLRHDFLGQDTIFHLSVPARIGLITLTTVIVVLWLLALWYGSSRFSSSIAQRSVQRNLPMRLLISFLGFTVNLGMCVGILLIALTAVPQILYGFYQLVFDFLPAQWVITSIQFDPVVRTFSLASVSSLNESITVLTITASVFLVILAWVWTLRLTSRNTQSQ